MGYESSSPKPINNFTPTQVIQVCFYPVENIAKTKPRPEMPKVEGVDKVNQVSRFDKHFTDELLELLTLPELPGLQ